MRRKENENTYNHYRILSDTNTITKLILYGNAFLLFFSIKRIIASKNFIHMILLYDTKVPRNTSANGIKRKPINCIKDSYVSRCCVLNSTFKALLLFHNYYPYSIYMFSHALPISE